MFKNKLLLFICLSFAFLFLINFFILQSLEKDYHDNKSAFIENAQQTIRKEAAQRKVIPVVTPKRVLVPEDPAKYGIISISKKDMPRQQEEWDMLMKRVVEDTRLMETEKGQAAVEKMKTPTASFEETMGRVDAEIAKFEGLKADNPLDEKIEERLQGLYKIKALGKALKSKVTSP